MTSRSTPPGARKRRRPTRSGVVLDEQTIVQTALRLLRDEGLAGFSTRRIGRALGSDHTAIYRYFRDVNDLELAIADEMIARAADRWQRTGDWHEDLARWGLNAHAVYMENPAAAQLTATRITGGDTEITAVEAIIQLLRDAGFPPPHAVMFYELFISQLLAYAQWDGAKRLLPDGRRSQDIARWRDIYMKVDAERFPALAENAELMGDLQGLDTYPRVLKMLLSSMKATLAELNRAT